MQAKVDTLQQERVEHARSEASLQYEVETSKKIIRNLRSCVEMMTVERDGLRHDKDCLGHDLEQVKASNNSMIKQHDTMKNQVYTKLATA